MHILITGGAGFVGSSLALFLRKKSKNIKITTFDNLYRRGSEKNIPALQENGIEFLHGDVRNNQDLNLISRTDVIIECSAEPSVLSGLSGSPEYLIQTNLFGALNCLEICRKNKSKLIFLSSSRVYPFDVIRELALSEKKTRFSFNTVGNLQPGISRKGISEEFTTTGIRSLYGATKLSAEMFCNEYSDAFGVETVINRCGVIAGPGQFGKTDQGFVTFWMKQHLAQQPISFIGYGGSGKQVRDILDISDLCNLIWQQIETSNIAETSIYNVGGGLKNSLSLLELTKICEEITGNSLPLSRVSKNRPADIPIFITDNSLVEEKYGWKQKKTTDETLIEISKWLRGN